MLRHDFSFKRLQSTSKGFSCQFCNFQRPIKDDKPKVYDSTFVESLWYDWWKRNNFFADERKTEKSKYNYTMCLPNISGNLHIGHALTVAIEDTVARWQRMCGETVTWVPGFDHAGIATQCQSPQKSIPSKASPYILSQGKDRLQTLNNAMKDIANLDGKDWSNALFLLTRPIAQVSDQAARTIAKVATSACTAVCNVLAPGEASTLFAKVAQHMIKQDPATIQDKTLKAIVDAIDNASNINQHVPLLSQICGNYSSNELKVNVAFYNYSLKLARKHKQEIGIGRPVARKDIIRHKLSLEKVCKIIFIMYPINDIYPE